MVTVVGIRAFDREGKPHVLIVHADNPLIMLQILNLFCGDMRQRLGLNTQIENLDRDYGRINTTDFKDWTNAPSPPA